MRTRKKSRPLLFYVLTKGKLLNTILHELCHAMPNTKGHGKQWKEYAALVGRMYNTHITRCSIPFEYYKTTYKYSFTCPVCKKVYGYFRVSKIVKAAIAGKPVFCAYKHSPAKLYT